MSLKQSILNLFKKDISESVQKENERLKMELGVLEKLEREIKKTSK